MNNFILSGQALAEGIALSWPRVANVVHYEIRRQEPPSPRAIIGIAEKAIYFDAETFTGVSYLYQVHAVLDGGGSLSSSLLEITSAGPQTTTRMTLGATGIHRE